MTRTTTLLTLPLLAACLSSAQATPQGETWRYLRPGNTGIQGDYCEAIWIGADGDPYIAGYQPFWEDGGFARFVQAQNRWECFSTIDYPEIGDRALVGAARVHDITDDGQGKLWMATWRALLEFRPSQGASSLKRWDLSNTPHPGGRTMDVEVAPDGSVWATVFSVSWGNGGLLRYQPASQAWSFWGYGMTANGWPNLGASCDELAVQPKPGGGYTVWIKADNTGRMITFDSGTQVFTQLSQTGAPGEVVGLAGHDSVDDAGNLWAWRVPPGGGLSYVLEMRRPDGSWVNAPQAGVGAAFKAYGNGLALGVDGNSFAWRFDGTSWQNLGQWRPGGFTYAINSDAAGNVWVSGTGGAARRDATTGTWQRYRVTNTSMLDYFARDLSLDDQGGVWMTGNAGPGVGGMQHFDGTRWFNFNVYTYGLGGPWGFPTDNADAIAARAGGSRVVVNPMFNGIHEWTGTQFQNLQGMGESEGLVEDSLGRIWSVGTYFSLRVYDGNGWSSVPIAGWGANIVKDPSRPGTVWAAANLEVVRTDGTYRFGRLNTDFPELNPQHDVLTTVAAAPGGIAWIGSTEGLFRVDANTGMHQWFHPSNSGIPGDQISPMAVTPDGRVWFTNFGSNWPDRGLGWFDGAALGYFPEAQGGLTHAQIADMEVRLVPGGYELWLACTSEGIAVLSVPTEPVGTVLCAGDGSAGTPCPCGNGSAAGSGSGCVNSTGAGATLRGTGTASVAADDLVLSAAQLPTGVNGLMFMGGTLSGALPFGDGLRCVGSPLFRFAPKGSGSSGGFGYGPGLAAYAQAHFGPGGWILPGSTWGFQVWYRDPAGPCMSGNDLSNSLSVTFVP